MGDLGREEIAACPACRLRYAAAEFASLAVLAEMTADSGDGGKNLQRAIGQTEFLQSRWRKSVKGGFTRWWGTIGDIRLEPICDPPDLRVFSECPDRESDYAAAHESNPEYKNAYPS
jgi:hypothetical protein